VPTSTTLDDDIVDAIFDFQIRDFSTYAVALHGKPSSTPAQQDWAVSAIRKPTFDQTGHRKRQRAAAHRRDGDVRIVQRLLDQRDGVGLAEPGQQHGDGFDAVIGIALDRPTGAGNDDVAGLGRIECA
jgi:hypothetical protein